MKYLNNDDSILSRTFKILYKIFIKLVSKYVNKLLIKNKKLIQKFYNYKLKSNKLI